MGLGREQIGQTRRRRAGLVLASRRNLRMLLFVEHRDSLFIQWVPSGTGPGLGGASECSLINLRIAPHDCLAALIHEIQPLRAAAVEVSASEYARGRLTIVRRRPAVVPSVEGVS